MKTNDRRNASRNELYARFNSFEVPCTPLEYSGGRFRSFTYCCTFARASASDAFCGTLADIVTTRWRLSLEIDDGLRPSVIWTTRERSTGTPLLDETEKSARFTRVLRKRSSACTITSY